MITSDSLRKILELECKREYSDKAVIGGLDKYLHKQAGKIRQSINNRQLLAEFDELNLANSNYSSCDVSERKRWIMRLFDWLGKLEAKQAALTSPHPSRDSSKVRVTAVAKSHPLKKSEGLNSPTTIIKGITPRVATKFAKLNVRTIHDLLYFFPGGMSITARGNLSQNLRKERSRLL